MSDSSSSRRTSGTAARPPAGPAELPFALLDGRRLLSLDVFDTALGRLVARPVDLFLFVAESYRARRPVVAFDFAAERVAAEQRARRHAVADGGSEEVTLQEIYRALELPPDWRADELRELELQCELELTRANADVLALAREARRRGLPVVFVSDTYLPATFLRRLLTHHGFEVDQLFASCEERHSKHRGGLWPLMVARSPVPASEIVHIGDAEEGDVRRARAAGLTAHRYRATAAVKVDGPSASLRHALVRRRLDGRREDFWSRLGYGVAGPFYLGFVSWLIERMAADRIERVFFCARDGYVWQRVYEELRAAGVAAPPSEYLYASRRAFYIPGLTRIDEEALDYLCAGLTELRVADYLVRCGLPVDEEAVRAVGLPSGDAIVRSGEDRRRLRDLFRHLTPQLLAHATAERATLLDYLRQVRLVDVRRAALVDIGWHGNVQLGLTRALALAHEPVQLFGYYVGTFGRASRLRALGPAGQGWLCTEGLPAAHEAVIRNCIEIFEFLHLAPHPSVVRFEANAGRVEPVFGADDADHFKHEAAARLQDAALEYARDCLQAARPFPWLRLDGAQAWAPLRRLIEEPSVDEAAHLGELAHADGFGPAFNAKPIAHPRVEPRLRQLRALYRDYHASFWKEGYIARQFGASPRVRRLMRVVRQTRSLPQLLGSTRIELPRVRSPEFYFKVKDDLYDELDKRAPRLLSYLRKLAPLLRRLEQRRRKR